MSEADSSNNNDDGGFTWSFYGSLFLAMGTVLVFGIMLAIAINTLQNTADIIINVAQTGAAGIQNLGKTLVAQAQLLVNANNGEILQSAQDATFAIINGVDTTINVLIAVGGSLLKVILDGFSALAEILQELGQQIVILFLASVAPYFIKVQFELIDVVAIVQIATALLNTIISPIIVFFKTLDL